MRNTPTSDDKKELDELKALPWQLALLDLNPEYTCWGNFEDGMSKKGDWWDCRSDIKTWDEYGPWELDDYNECVNFYFEVYRKNHKCPHCDGSGLNTATKQLSDDWYDMYGTGRRWSDKITDVEVEALMKGGRLWGIVDGWRGFFDEETGSWMQWVDGKKVKTDKPQFPTAAEVNAHQHSRKGFGHDAINHWICTEARAKHLGVFGHCDQCEGGYIYDEPVATVALQLWILHPRKGVSKGVYIETITEDEVPAVKAWLKQSAERNANRFSQIK